MSSISATNGWNFEKVLGTGGFGIVQLWVHAESGKKLAIKKCKWDASQLTDTQRKRWANEVQIMRRLDHPNIVKAINLPFTLTDDHDDLWLLPILCMEYCKKGDLRRVLSKAENCCGIQEEEAINVMKSISSAVEYLHSHSITHRDLKPENIVIQDERGIISYKLIDLGYAKDLGEASASASIVGTLNYVAPELLWNKKYSCSVDYWSLGILFYELITGTRPFLPRMPHTMKWMEHIKNKEYDYICAIESEGKIIFGKDIGDPTHISRCLRNRLVHWFRVTLQWDPKRRGRECDENGDLQLVVFQLLQSILSWKIVHVFCISTYKIDSYEVLDTTSVTEIQCAIEKETNIPLSEQILTDYFGNVLVETGSPLLSQIRDPILFVFKSMSNLMETTPVINIPMPIQKMIELSRSQLDLDTLKDHYRVTIFFIYQEVRLLRLYIFALCIKVDLIISKLNAFNESMTRALENTNALLSELHAVREKWEKGNIDEERRKALEKNLEKVTHLVHAADQIKMKFNVLMKESNQLRNAVQSIDSVNNALHLYNKALSLYEGLKESSHKGGKPTEMVKLVFDFVKVREEQLHNEKTLEIKRQISKSDVELLTLERIFDSVIAMTTVYHEEFQRIIQYDLQCATENLSNMSITSQSPNASTSTSTCTVMEGQSNVETNAMDTTNESDNKTVNNDDIIYDNLVIRYTLDNLLIEMQKKYLEMLSLDP